MTHTVLGELIYRLPIAYGGEVQMLSAEKIVELLQRELEDLILKEKEQIIQAYEHGRSLGNVCNSEAYYRLKYERR